MPVIIPKFKIGDVIKVSKDSENSWPKIYRNIPLKICEINIYDEISYLVRNVDWAKNDAQEYFSIYERHMCLFKSKLHNHPLTNIFK